MAYTDDPVADFHAHENEIDNRNRHLPVCSYCQDKIRDDEYYRIEGKNYCSSCLETYFKEWNG